MIMILLTASSVGSLRQPMLMMLDLSLQIKAFAGIIIPLRRHLHTFSHNAGIGAELVVFNPAWWLGPR